MNIIQLFTEVNMGKQHNGLREIAKKGNINVDRLKHGEFVVFLNKKANAMKVWATSGVLGYMKTTSRYSIDDVAMFVRAFDAPHSPHYTGHVKNRFNHAVIASKELEKPNMAKAGTRSFMIRRGRPTVAQMGQRP